MSNRRELSHSSRIAILLILLLTLLLFSIPLTLANHTVGAASAFLILALLFFFPGYAFFSLLGRPEGGLRLLLSPIFGIVSVVTIYDFWVRRFPGSYFCYAVAVVSCVGVVLFMRNLHRGAAATSWKSEDPQALIAGTVVALAVAPLYWRSGRFAQGEFVFYGPAGRDPLFHVTLLQRLLHHVPPDNFIAAGLRAPVYHYFDDLTLALSLQAQRALHLRATDVFDLYYRCYPTLLYFLLGALAYRIGRQLLPKLSGGVLGALLLLGAGGIGWPLGALPVLAHVTHFAAARTRFFSEWGSWNGVDAILPLVHRPAHYHSLLICLAAISLILQPDRGRRDWITAGLLLGLMAGFNFTLAATFGISAVLVALFLWLRFRPDEARQIAWLAAVILIGSLPVVLSMLFSGFHNPAPGFPFRGPNLEFTTSLWSDGLGRLLPSALVPFTALLVFPLLVYGIRLFGLPRLSHADLGEVRHANFAGVLAVAFAISFVVGVFFPYKAQGGVAVIFIQPTLWILALFSVLPLGLWLERRSGSWWSLVLWGFLGAAWLHTLATFNFEARAVFSAKTMNIFKEIRASAAPDEVIAYTRSDLVEEPILGYGSMSTNFTITGLTGLDGYFSSETYSTSFSVPGLQGRDDSDVLAQAERLYQQRREDVDSFLDGSIGADGTARLSKDHVCWLVASGDEPHNLRPAALPWRRTPDMAVYRLCPN